MTKELPEEISLSDGESTREFDLDDSRLTYKHHNGTVELHKECLICLEPDEYLNDTVVQFYLAYLLKEVCPPKTRSKVHIFDSIFYEQVEKIFQDETIDYEKLAQIKRWYGDVDIFEKDFLIFPVCSGQHWFALVVCYPKSVTAISIKKIIGGDKNNDNDNGRRKRIPGIIIMDSLNLKKRRITAKIRDFLDYDWRCRGLEIKRFSYSDLKDYNAPFPKQRNAFDCGIYMLMYIQCFIDMGPEEVYSVIERDYRDGKESEEIIYIKEKISELIEINDRSVIKELIETSCKNGK